MNYNNSPNYFSYKKSKYRKDIAQPPKPMSKINFLFQLFVATFIIMFIVIVISIMKYSSKMDIEYSKKEMKLNNTFSPFQRDLSETSQNYENERQLKIDKRLILIQQEENAPSEAKIINTEKMVNEVIDPVHLENNKKIEKEEKIQEFVNKIEESEHEATKKTTPVIPENNNITIMSKVLVGRFSTFEDAQRLQGVIKAKDSSLAPYVKKIGDVFTVQLGSYQDFNIAKNQANILKAKGLDVWIYQQ